MAVSPIAEAYKAAFSFSSLPVALVEALAGGLVIAFSVSFFLLWLFSRLPGKNPIFKALILSFSAVVIIEVLFRPWIPGSCALCLPPARYRNECSQGFSLLDW